MQQIPSIGLSRFVSILNQANYISGWQARIDLYMSLFPRRVGMATHNQPGTWGWEHGKMIECVCSVPLVAMRQCCTAGGTRCTGADALSGPVCAPYIWRVCYDLALCDAECHRYTVEQQVTAARSIRDHLLSRAEADARTGRPTPVVRDCGGSNDTHVWGVPNVTVGGPRDLPPPSDFALLLWEVRTRAAMGIEQAGIVPRKLSIPAQVNFMYAALQIQTYYNVRYLEVSRWAVHVLSLF